jgi:SsrA-binding protein
LGLGLAKFKKKRKGKVMNSKKTKKGEGEKIICKNRRAAHQYTLGARYEAGLVLLGSEVKSCREGKAHLNQAYVKILNGEAILIGANIDLYSNAQSFGHEPDRTRKLLLHASELHKLILATEQKGSTLIPLSLYFKEGRVKLELAVATGKKQVDKRAAIKDRESKREIERVTIRRQKS